MLEAKLIALLLEVIARTTCVIYKIQKYSFILMSATLRGLVVILRCSQLLKSSFLSCGIENGQLLQYGHAYMYQLSVLLERKNTCMRAPAYVYIHVLQNGEKMERYASKRSCKRNGTLTFY